jgi:hypothetical protein
MADLQIQTDKGLLSAKDLLLALLELLAGDEAAREWAAQIIGPAAPRGEPGIAWVPNFALVRGEDGKNYLRIIGWFAWPADAGPPPTGYVGQDGIVTDEDGAEIVTGLLDGIMRERACDEAEARAFLEQNRAEFVKAIMRQGAQNTSADA